MAGKVKRFIPKSGIRWGAAKDFPVVKAGLSMLSARVEARAV